MSGKTYIFRGREILVDGGGDAAAAEAASLAACPGAFRCDDPQTGCSGIELPAGTEAPAGCRFLPIPSYFFAHDDAENARASRMKGLAQWHAKTRFCPSCGQALQPGSIGNSLECPACGRLLFPRIEPCIITLVTRGDELLLLRNVKDREGIYACLAGFVEIGETLEECVRREVREELGIAVKNIEYYKSQPWGVAGDVLAGFWCDVDGDPTLHMDAEELGRAAWVAPEDIAGQGDDLSLTNEMMCRWRDEHASR